MLKFPCFRDKEWMQKNESNLKYPDEFLKVSFRPEFLKNYENVKNFEEKVEYVIRQIKTALFRQAIYKIQNIEVLAMGECKEDRVLEKIKQMKGYNNFKLTTNKIISDELWTVKRCKRNMYYWVRSYEQDKNGYSLSIFPLQIKNIFYYFKFYYF